MAAIFSPPSAANGTPKHCLSTVTTRRERCAHSKKRMRSIVQLLPQYRQRRRMSEVGTSRTWCDVRVESAMRRITDIGEQPPARAISRGTLADAARNRLMTSPILEARRRLPGQAPAATLHVLPRELLRE